MFQSRFKPLIDHSGAEHDKGVFFIVLFAGLITIVGLRPFVPPLITIIILVLLIAFYAYYAINHTSRAGISVDRAGDNAYYLGLLFTLISLCSSLLYISENQAHKLLIDFGIAMVSTIAGIGARIVIQQFRGNPEDIEARAGHDLNRASRKLHTVLSKTIKDMDQASLEVAAGINKNSKAMDATAQEVLSRTKQMLEMSEKAHAETFASLSQEVLSRTRKTLEESEKAHAEAFSSLARKIEQPVSYLSVQIDLVGKSIKEFTSVVQQHTDRLKTSSASADESLKDLSAEIEQARQTIEKAKNQHQNFSNAMSNLTDKFSELIPENTLQQFHSNQDEALRRQRQLLSQLNAQERSVREFMEQMSGIGGRTSAAAGGLERELASQVKIVQEKAGQLEQELSRMSDNVPKISKNLEQGGQVAMSQLEEASGRLGDIGGRAPEVAKGLEKAMSQFEETSGRLGDIGGRAPEVAKGLEKAMSQFEETSGRLGDIGGRAPEVAKGLEKAMSQFEETSGRLMGKQQELLRALKVLHRKAQSTEQSFSPKNRALAWKNRFLVWTGKDSKGRK